MSLKDFFLSWGMILIGVITNVMGIFLIKLKMSELGAIEVGSFKLMMDYFFTLMKSPLVIAGIVLFGIACFPLAIAVSRMELAIAYPLSIALSCLIIVPLSIVFLGEILNFYKITAIILVIVSVYFFYK